MKLINLNVWGGKINKPLLDFLKEYSKEIDIFCLQEILNNASKEIQEGTFKFSDADPDLLEHISGIFTGHRAFFCPVFKDIYGIATFVRKEIKVIESGDVILYESNNFPDVSNPDTDHTRKMQWLRIENGSNEYLIMNIHGHWVSRDKKDNKERLVQSEKILTFASKFKLPKIICGDFNLLPNTKSIKMLEKSFKNLITENMIQSTRTSLYNGPEKFADYVFISPEIKVKSFQVLKEEVSDHTPLFLEFG